MHILDSTHYDIQQNICKCIHTHVCIHIFICTQTYTHTRTNIHIHIHDNIHAYVKVFKYVNTYLYVLCVTKNASNASAFSDLSIIRFQN